LGAKLSPARLALPSLKIVSASRLLVAIVRLALVRNFVTARVYNGKDDTLYMLDFILCSSRTLDRYNTLFYIHPHHYNLCVCISSSTLSMLIHLLDILMASPEKQSTPQTRVEPQVSPSLYHRDSGRSTVASLNTPRKHAVLTKMPLLPISGTPQLDGTRIPPRSPVPYPMTGPADLEEDYPHWMNGFCKEPGGDGATCCQAFFCPGYLHGKTEWRIKRFSSGKNGFDDAWDCMNDGCNANCMTFNLMAVLLPCRKYARYVCF
jgi:hypothetical protein